MGFVKCNTCGKKVSNVVGEDIVVKAFVQCGECITLTKEVVVAKEVKEKDTGKYLPPVTVKYRVTLTEEMLGTGSSDPNIHVIFIASNAPDAQSTEEEVAAMGVDEVVKRQMTIFPRENGIPFVWDYQMKGFLKSAVSAQGRIPGSYWSKIKAYIRTIEDLIFPKPRKMMLNLPEGASIGSCQRPIRIKTPQGDRVALANSETVPAGTWFDMDIFYLNPLLQEPVEQLLDYGQLRGLLQWRGGGKGTFTYKKL